VGSPGEFNNPGDNVYNIGKLSQTAHGTQMERETGFPVPSMPSFGLRYTQT